MKSLEQLRKGVGLSQLELATLFKVSDRTIYNYERDSTNIPNSLLDKYMIAFDIEYDDIFLGKKYDFIVQQQGLVYKRLRDKKLA